MYQNKLVLKWNKTDEIRVYSTINKLRFLEMFHIKKEKRSVYSVENFMSL